MIAAPMAEAFTTEVEFDPPGAFGRLLGLPHSVWLDSARPHPEFGTRSLLAADPFLVFRAEGNGWSLRGEEQAEGTGDPWPVLAHLLARFLPAGAPGGEAMRPPVALGFFGYESGRWLDRSPPLRPPPAAAPDLWFGFYDAAVFYDHAARRARVMADPSRAARGALRRSAALRERLEGAEAPPRREGAFGGRLTPLMGREAHARAVRRALEGIRRGDLYQVNLTRAYSGTLEAAPADAYLRLRKTNPAPFAGWLDCGDVQVLSSSPERFLRLEGRHVQTRPIKGTRLRRGDPTTDLRAAAELAASGKDRAELLMITDLLRNDLGRVAETGSVCVPRLAEIEEYETVFHLVSTIEARLRPGATHLDALRAAFPGGSVTGAPKLQAIKLISEIEPCGRGPYTGAMGWFGAGGRSDFNILIRTLTLREGAATFHVGGGIVAESEPSAEYAETLAKAEGLLRLWRQRPEET
ncbi:MAG: aminodeoxychorismate synthase component I [Verrucomicrobiae bacterium]|nr:aminodeoxychorismate synthase component I [Verrucomicrobiae bacterium]